MPYSMPKLDCCSASADEACCRSCGGCAERFRGSSCVESCGACRHYDCACNLPWPCGLLWLLVRLATFVITHVTFFLALNSKCVYYQLWKFYDIFWIYLHILLAICFPMLRPDTTPFAIGYYLKSRCCRSYSCKDSLRSIDDPVQAIADPKIRKIKTRIANGVDFAVVVLRLRVSVALMLGNIHRSTFNKEGLQGVYAMFYQLVWLDIIIFWFSVYFAIIRQFCLMCQLGCVKYYFWLILVFAVGFAFMEFPAEYVKAKLDHVWCSIVVAQKNETLACKLFQCRETWDTPRYLTRD